MQASWHIPIELTCPLADCAAVPGLRQYYSYYSGVLGGAEVCISEKEITLRCDATKICAAYETTMALFKTNNVTFVQTGIRDVIYTVRVHKRVDMAAFARTHGITPALGYLRIIDGTRVTFHPEGISMWWRGRVDVEGLKYKALAMLE
jgi:hypothetical protein